jgi:hypothetical protein
MNSKIQVYERIQSIIDEEIQKSKDIILERCKSLFDEILTTNNKNMLITNNDNKLELCLEEKEEDENNENIDDKDSDDSDSIEEIIDNDINRDRNNDNDSNEDSDEDDEVPVYEIEINNEMYFVSDEEPNFIFEIMEDDTVGDCVGIYMNDVPYFITFCNGERCYLNVKEGTYHKYVDNVTIGQEI